MMEDFTGYCGTLLKSKIFAFRVELYAFLMAKRNTGLLIDRRRIKWY